MNDDEPPPKRWGTKVKNEFAPMWKKYGNDIQIIDAFEYYRPDRNPQWKISLKIDKKKHNKKHSVPYKEIKKFCDDHIKRINNLPRHKPSQGTPYFNLPGWEDSD